MSEQWFERDPLWFKRAVFYEIHIRGFFDGNDDGSGDFRGLMDKLDYLEWLGVDCLWLLPMYESPLRDGGYDISNFFSLHPDYGSVEDFREFVEQAHQRGMRVIADLVMNHTSADHPWFVESRADPAGPKGDWYVWSETDERYPEARIIFIDAEPSNWTLDQLRGEYYWHRFFHHQPDLNYENPEVQEAMLEVLRFWLDLGIDGFRLDAVPYLFERDGTNGENLPETHEYLKRVRAEVDARYPDRLLLAEANQWPEDVVDYFGDGDECQMCFHFPVMPRMFMALRREDSTPIYEILDRTPKIPDNCQWGLFLRNHDELTLEMVTDEERDYMYEEYAKDPRMKLNLGIRRRLAPLLDAGRDEAELLHAILFSLPGSPVLYYGDEIGMGDNVYLGDRDGVRTPMQWSPDRNGGFSRADPARLFLPAVADPIYGFDAVNVEAQERSPSSLLNWMKRLIAVRQQHKSFGRGTLRFLYPGNRKVLAYIREHEGEVTLCVANLSRSAQAMELDLSRHKNCVPVELLGRSTFPPIGDLPYLLTLPAYGFYWFGLTNTAEQPAWHEQMPEVMPEFVTLVVTDAWRNVNGRAATEFARDVLPAYLPKQRWFGAKDEVINSTRIHATAELQARGETFMLGVMDVVLSGVEEPQQYFLPLTVSWDENAATPASPLLPYTLARARRGPRLGGLYDAMQSDHFMLAVIDAIRRGHSIKSNVGTVEFQPTQRMAEVELPEAPEIRRLGVEQSNTSVLVGDLMVVKAYRKLVNGEHPELEIGRFLTEVADYRNTPTLLGAVQHVEEGGPTTALMIVQAFIRNQGDGWTFTLDQLVRYLDEIRLGGSSAENPTETSSEDVAFYLSLASTLGQRTAELHRALAIESGNPAF